MKVILKEDVQGVGNIGDVLEVARGYARNYLLPRNKAAEATGRNLKAVDHAKRVIAEQTTATSTEKMNRGHARGSFGDQLHHPEWVMLVDLPTILPAIEAIWRSPNFTCMGAGGDYSLPGAKIQPLHSDMGEFIHDPQGIVTFHDLPAPFIVVNFLMVDFTKENGAIRFVPATQRSRELAG